MQNKFFFVLLAIMMSMCMGMISDGEGATRMAKLLTKLEKFAKKIPQLDSRIAKKKEQLADSHTIDALKHKRFIVTKKVMKVELKIALLGATDKADEERIREDYTAELAAAKEARAADKAERKAARKAAKQAAQVAEGENV